MEVETEILSATEVDYDTINEVDKIDVNSMKDVADIKKNEHSPDELDCYVQDNVSCEMDNMKLCFNENYAKFEKSFMKEYSLAYSRLLSFSRNIIYNQTKTDRKKIDQLENNLRIKNIESCDYHEEIDKLNKNTQQLSANLKSKKMQFLKQKCFYEWFNKHTLRKCREKCVYFLIWKHKQRIKRKYLQKWKNYIHRKVRADRQKLIEQCKIKDTILNELQQKMETLMNKKNDENESIKSTFMRGLCALNIEAISLLKNKNDDKLSFGKALSDIGHTDKIIPQNIENHQSIELTIPSKRDSLVRTKEKIIHANLYDKHILRADESVITIPAHKYVI
ncbi:hypothetical protein A3Q56_03439 [Intoshia linei]|uniref:Protein of centriole 5 n=1 Tax=Intoshia linei TaxID=1819745 RepID=A0A177B3F4_9BILA|nr:hypothetical protein A3Q56_03439 [Intoshia linei]